MSKEVNLLAVLEKLKTEKPEVAMAINNLRTTIINNSALDQKTNALVGIGIAVAIKDKNALAGHIEIAKQSGASKEEIESCILMATPAIGVPAVLEALSITWE
ncbi:MAG: carboxymuconolactone decarboxylase family protein [Firmicutes bacterium]|nr:carboxymuconolactone decarboxylase family protein [Bacillota bacterium]